MDIKKTGATETMPMLRNRLQHGDDREKKLKEACTDFEAIFWADMMKNMRKTVPQDNQGVDGNQKEIFQSMFDQELAKQISRSDKSLGIGKSFYQSLTSEKK